MSTDFNKEEFYQSFISKESKGGCLKIFGAIGTGISLFFLVRNLMHPFEDSGENNGLRVVMGIILLVSLFLLWSGFAKFDPEKDPDLINFKTGGQHIIWVYPYNKTVNGFTSYWTNYMTKDGKLHSMPTVVEARQDYVIRGISNLYPEAEVGYSDEIRERIERKYNFSA